MQWIPAVRLLGFSFLALAWPSLATAGTDSYECEARQFLDWSADVDANPWPPKLDDRLEMGEHPQRIWDSKKQFTVSRESGQIIGGPLDTQGPATVRVKLIAPGSEDDNFKVLIEYGRGAGLLVIHEWWTGEDKPFVAMDSGGIVYTGVCR